MTTVEPALVVDRTAPVWTATINRPARKNAVGPSFWEELLALLGEVARASEARVLVLTGAGEDFCAGADLGELGAGPPVHPLDGMRRMGDCALALHRLTKPTIAKVRGVAVGAGCNLALACDLVLAAEDARFSEIFVHRSLSLDFGGSWLLPRLVGLHKAKELAFLGGMVGGREAEALGLINRAVPGAELDALVTDWAARLAEGPPLALSMSKTLLNDTFALGFDQALEAEARCQAVNFASADTREALRAFVEKRPARFSGR